MQKANTVQHSGLTHQGSPPAAGRWLESINPAHSGEQNQLLASRSLGRKDLSAQMYSCLTQFHWSFVLCLSVQVLWAGIEGNGAKHLTIKTDSHCWIIIYQPTFMPRQNSHRCQRFYFHCEIGKRCGFWNIINIKTTVWTVFSLLLSRETLRGDYKCKSLLLFSFFHLMAE